MAYFESLQQLLRPLGVYRLEPESLSGGELWAAGAALDAACEQIEHDLREALPLTAQDEGLQRLESLLGIQPVSPRLVFRQKALAALLRINESSFTLQDINAAIAGCGVSAQVREDDEPQSVTVRFPLLTDEPEEAERLKQIVEQLVPCHLKINYEVRYLYWREVEYSGWAWHIVGQWSWRRMIGTIPGVNY